MIKYFSFLLLFLTITDCFVNAQSSKEKKDTLTFARNRNLTTDGCKIDIAIEKCKLTFKKEDDKYVNVIIKNQGNDTIYIPSWFITGESIDPNAEIVFVVEKWDNELNIFAPSSDMQNHYIYLNEERDTISLPPNQEKLLKENFEICRKINSSGKYRLRLIIRKICTVHEIVSDWKEFEVIE